MKDDPFEHLREQHRKSKEALQPLKERWKKQFQKPAKTKEEIKAERLQEVRGKLQDLARKEEQFKEQHNPNEQWELPMKALLLICAGFLFLGIADLPIGYYTFLRIAVTFGAVAVIVIERDNGLNFWNLAFGLIAIVFNPIFPMYLNDKSLWIWIDAVSGGLFLIKALVELKN